MQTAPSSSETSTPLLSLPRLVSPSRAVPIMLPSTRLVVAFTLTPSPSLPEIRLRSARVAPPMMLFDPVEMAIPASPLPRSRVPEASVPTKLPATRLLLPLILMPTLKALLTTSPLIVLFEGSLLLSRFLGRPPEPEPGSEMAATEPS